MRRLVLILAVWLCANWAEAQITPVPPASRLLPIGCTTGQTATYNSTTNLWTCATDLGGSVTSVSVVSANGFGGSVATATTTPAITLTTSITGLLLGNATAVSAYGGTSCTNQFPRSLNGSGAATCESVAIGSDVSGLGTGVATVLGTPSSANLAAALTDETGTGLAVFGTAPTFASTLTVGTAGGTTGAINWKGTTSGTVTQTVAAAAGTWTFTLPTGAGSSGQFLQTDGAGVSSWQTVTQVSAANPTGTVGLTAVNGSAATFLRSDGAPALSQAIVPTWSGVHTFSATPVFSSHVTVEGVTSTGATGTGKIVFDGSPTIAKLANLTSNGFVKTGSGDGTLSIDTSTYLTSAGAVTSLAGTTNQITASAATGAVTLSLPSVIVTPGTVQVGSRLGVGAAPDGLYPLWIHKATNQNLFVNASDGDVAGSVTVSAANDAKTANVPLELRGSTNTLVATNGFASVWSGPAAPGAVERMRWHSSGGISAFSTSDPGVGVFSISGNLSVTGGSLASGANALSVTGTLSTTAANQNGILSTITTAGSASNVQRGLFTTLAAGYTGSSAALAGSFVSAVAGTGATGVAGGAWNGGLYGESGATTTGDNVGVYGWANGGNRSYGVLGNATVAKASATNIGVAGFGLNAGGGSPIQIGGYFGLQATNPTYASAALMADNGSTTSDIFVARDNGTAVFTIADGGVTTATNSITAASLATSAGALSITAAANAIALQTTGYSLTGSNASSMVNMTGTWNTTGAPTAWLMNITNTASGTASLLADWQVGGVSQFSISKAGALVTPTSLQSPLLIGGTGTTSTLTLKTTTGVGASGADLIFQVGNNGGTEAMRILNSGNVGIGTTSPTAALDVNPATSTITASANARITAITGALTEAASGTHTRIMGLEVTAPTITGGVATVTDTATLYVSGAPSATVTGDNYQAWFAGGTTQKVRIDGQLSLGANLALSSVAPTITSGFNTSPAVLTGSNAFSFAIDTGTTASSTTAVIGLPTAANLWSCDGQDMSDGGYVNQVASSTTSVSFKYYSRTTGLQINWPASTTFTFLCGAH